MALILSLAVFTNSGCYAVVLGAAAGAGSVAYVKGRIEKNFDRPVKKVNAATLSALKGLDIFVISDELTTHESEIKGEYDDGKEVKIKIIALTEKSSKITIRVGVLGNEEKSLEVLNAVIKKL